MPAIVQDAATRRVLMLGYMDRAALEATIASRKVTFYSRSRRKLWMKGETSGHVLELVSIVLGLRQRHAACAGDTAGTDLPSRHVELFR